MTQILYLIWLFPGRGRHEQAHRPRVRIPARPLSDREGVEKQIVKLHCSSANSEMRIRFVNAFMKKCTILLIDYFIHSVLACCGHQVGWNRTRASRSFREYPQRWQAALRQRRSGWRKTNISNINSWKIQNNNIIIKNIIFLRKSWLFHFQVVGQAADFWHASGHRKKSIHDSWFPIWHLPDSSDSICHFA